MLSRKLLEQKRRFAHFWLSPADTLLDELLQAQDEGLMVTDEYRELAECVNASNEPNRDECAVNIMEQIRTTQIRDDYPYQEPDDLDTIIAECDPMPPKAAIPDEATLYDRIYGALQGRCSGCLLGQPVEGFLRERIEGFLKDTSNYPIHQYLSSDVSQAIRTRYGITDEAFVYGGLQVNWINNIRHMPEDDDTNYTILGLKLMEDYGLDFTSQDVAEHWLMEVPLLHTCVSERIAYRNFVNRLLPPESGHHQNPYRETVGAQIRADSFGYVSFGDPARAMGMAFRDACATHTKNGVYGEMWVAAMLAAVPQAPTAQDAVRFGIGAIPKASRLRECVAHVISCFDQNISVAECLEMIHNRFSEYVPFYWFNELPNAMIVAYALLYGAGDFERTIGLAVEAGFDTDCNGATVGSLLGIRLGARCLPEAWITPLNDGVFTTVAGYGLLSIRDITKRFIQLIQNKR